MKFFWNKSNVSSFLTNEMSLKQSVFFIIINDWKKVKEEEEEKKILLMS